MIKVTTEQGVYPFKNMKFFFETEKINIYNFGLYRLGIRELSCIRGGVPFELFMNEFKNYPLYRLKNSVDSP